MELDLLRACVGRWGEVPGVSSAAANLGFCSGGTLVGLLRHPGANKHACLDDWGEDQKLNYFMLERGNES